MRPKLKNTEKVSCIFGSIVFYNLSDSYFVVYLTTILLNLATMQKIVLIAGGSGLIGRKLTEHILQAGWECRVLTRNEDLARRANFFHWRPDQDYLDPAALLGVTDVINLAGVGIADSTWTKERKKAIVASRVQSTQVLCQKLRGHSTALSMTNASAIGIYGNGYAPVDERSATPPIQDSFLYHTCSEWEGAFHQYCPPKLRSIVLRIGLVLSRSGGILPKMAMGTRFGLGTYFGDGEHYLSWIHIDDLVRAFLYVIEHADSIPSGVVNGTAPNPCTQRAFVATLLRVRSIWGGGVSLGIPSRAIRLVLGELSEAVLMGNRVMPAALSAAGFDFRHSSLEDALREEYP